uniref:60S ribosomal protein L6 n=3 Tax=unclassified Salmonella TaxID=2614656 RepID=UPI00397EDA78
KEITAEVKTITKEIGGDKNGGSRTVPVKREPRYYPTEDCRKKLPNRKKQRPTKLRSTLVPGTVVILLAGKHQGKRVVFLKQFHPSGLLLVTGPFKVNGVPLRRVPQTYVIATQTKLDISGVNLPEGLNDDYFKREKRQKKRTEEMFEESKEERTVSEERIEDQKQVDEQIAPLISKEAHLKKYLKSLFTLRKGQYPHNMIF